MRVKVKKGSPKRSIQIVDSTRIGDKIKQRIIRHLGMAETDAEEKALRAYGDSVIERMKSTPVPVFPSEDLADRIRHTRQHPQENWSLKVRDDLIGVQAVNDGIHDVFGEVYRDLGLDRIVPRHRYPTSNRALYHCVMARLAQPRSERAMSSLLGDEYGVALPLQKIYRMMDQLDDDRIGRLNSFAARSAQQLSSDPVDAVFVDCTTLNFDSSCGHGLEESRVVKDANLEDSQVLLALFVTSGGLPLGYELMPGPTSEVTSLIPAISALKERLNLRHAVCVADRGRMPRDNLRVLEKAGLDWIIDAPIGRMDQQVQKRVLEGSGHTPSKDGDSRIVDIDLENRTRLVASFSPSRAARDRHSREALLKKLRTRIRSSRHLNASSLAQNQGWKR